MVGEAGFEGHPYTIENLVISAKSEQVFGPSVSQFHELLMKRYHFPHTSGKASERQFAHWR
ncbi:MAG: hypothetical protein JO031_15945 [Ktedonobacteraceae bacterium]|nr:hypothetical protein [Ktedonobacteraceae bacterium]